MTFDININGCSNSYLQNERKQFYQSRQWFNYTLQLSFFECHYCLTAVKLQKMQYNINIIALALN